MERRPGILVEGALEANASEAREGALWSSRKSTWGIVPRGATLVLRTQQERGQTERPGCAGPGTTIMMLAFAT